MAMPECLYCSERIQAHDVQGPDPELYNSETVYPRLILKVVRILYMWLDVIFPQIS